MKKQRYLKKIKDKKSYSFQQLAEILCIHVRTVQTWYKSGMQILEGTACPYLVMGKDVKQFLKNLSDSKKIKLDKGQCYCVVCHVAVAPLNPEIHPNNKKIGKDKESISLIGKCPHCNRGVRRFDIREISNLKTKKEE